eukprot:TRINITY_DN61253_c0_g1_i1.p1 TRINITY_DN61253_c0_g1~~TRINITY_DN61253_c0_g1_i1.p1  ORF type:complete len:100 (+),score=5.75 TRINITY_DN61253_c0_g1_i1:27-326(+)
MHRVALVGTGRMGALRAAFINRHPSLKLTAVLDVTKDKAQELAKLYPGCDAASITDFDHVLKHHQNQGLWIASSTHTHPILIQRAASLEGVKESLKTIY